MANNVTHATVMTMTKKNLNYMVYTSLFLTVVVWQVSWRTMDQKAIHGWTCLKLCSWRLGDG